MQAISNQWAAMPSLHLAWAAWCVYALYPILRRKVSRSILLTYPLLTLFTIVVTGNHYWIDGIAGLLTLALGATIGNRLNGYWGRRRLITSLKL
jgi:membrane-associated phospholipid phosphatase